MDQLVGLISSLLTPAPLLLLLLLDSVRPKSDSYEAQHIELNSYI